MKKVVKETYSATGRRKEAVARAKLCPDGSGVIKVNEKALEKCFPTVDTQNQVKRPLVTTELEKNIDVWAKVSGGGLSGQAGALSLAISRCLVIWKPELRTSLKDQNLLTRDPRVKERKKYGRKGARKRFQWTKR